MTQMGKLRDAEVEANLPRSASHGKARSPRELETCCAEQPGTCRHLSCAVTRRAPGLLVRAGNGPPRRCDSGAAPAPGAPAVPRAWEVRAADAQAFTGSGFCMPCSFHFPGGSLA